MGANKKTAAVIVVVVLEITMLMVAPLAYFTFYAPKPEPELKHLQTYPLTDSQIREAWPNLPSAQQLFSTGAYRFYNTNDFIICPNSTANKIILQTPPRSWDNSSVTLVIENGTLTHIAGIPVIYHIYLQLNATMWIVVPQTYLEGSSHPPVLPTEGNYGFLGTNLPSTYGVVAVAIILVTIVLGVCYLVFMRYRAKPDAVGMN